jgi:hypothetical protein
VAPENGQYTDSASSSAMGSSESGNARSASSRLGWYEMATRFRRMAVEKAKETKAGAVVFKINDIEE